MTFNSSRDALLYFSSLILLHTIIFVSRVGRLNLDLILDPVVPHERDKSSVFVHLVSGFNVVFVTPINFVKTMYYFVDLNEVVLLDDDDDE